MAIKQCSGSKTNSKETKDNRLRKGLATVLYVFYWLILIGTFVLDYQEHQKIVDTQEVLSGTWLDVTPEMTD